MKKTNYFYLVVVVETSEGYNDILVVKAQAQATSPYHEVINHANVSVRG